MYQMKTKVTKTLSDKTMYIMNVLYIGCCECDSSYL